MSKFLAACVFTAGLAYAAASFAADPLPNSMLDPKSYNPAVDPDYDMFIGDWHNALPRNIHGSLVVRDILTKLEGPDHLHPTRKGACLTELLSVSYATLERGASTKPDKLSGVQELFYVVAGEGTITSGGKTFPLHDSMGIVIPPDVEYSMKATGASLAMYMVVEPIPAGFTPKKEIAVRDEFDNDQFISVHWSNIDRTVIGTKDGTAVIGGFTAVKIDPMIMAQPHSHDTGTEEVWIAVKGDIKVLIGKQFREFPMGSAYRVPSTGETAHANVNLTGTQAKLIHMMKNVPGRTFPYGQLNPKLYDPAVDPDIDMFMGDRLLSMPRNIHGSMVIRDILVQGNGDPLKPTRKSACLTDLVSVSYATLEPRAHTEQVTLKDEQEIFYVQSGAGVLETAGKKTELKNGVALLVPPGVSYTISAKEGEPLAMYRVVEPVAASFKPRKDILVKYEYDSMSGNYSHWVYNVRGLFKKEDGLAVLTGIAPVTLDPMTFGQPHSHEVGVEEVWIGLEGDISFLLGKQLRHLPAGAAYKIPPNGMTAHANINNTKQPIKLIWMMKLPQ